MAKSETEHMLHLHNSLFEEENESVLINSVD